MNRLLVVIGWVVISATGTWAGTIQSHTWGFPQREVDPNLVVALTRQTADPNTRVRVTAIEELGRLRAAQAWEAIAGRLGDKAVVQTEAGKVTVAAVACAALGLLGERQAVPHLIPPLEDEQLRDVASRALCLLKNRFRVGKLQVADLLRDSAGQAGGSDLRDPVLGTDPANWKAWWTRQGLSEREVMVRVYKNPDENPTTFELVKAKAAGNDIPLEAIPGADPCSIVLICPHDQQDEDLRIMMGRWVMACCVSDAQSLPVPDRMWPYPSLDATRDRWMFDDALGKPIRDALVEVWLVGMDKAREVHRIRLGQWTAPESGIETVRVNGGFHPRFVVSHREYGKASVIEAPPQPQPIERIRVHLVPLGSEVHRRAIWGTVVDESGRAVQDATIECRSVRTRDEKLISPDYRYGRGEAITDANGFFSLYILPEQRFAEQQSPLIPLESRYLVTVTPPASSGLPIFEGPVANGAPARIVLEPPAGKARTFVFETSDGALKDPEQLKDITIVVQRLGKMPLTYSYAQWSTGQVMPEGTYIASLKNGGPAGRFEPLLVSETSPDVLVFRPQHGMIYSGRVVNAKTRLPVVGAFVLAEITRGRGRFSDFTDGQWDRLEQLGVHPLAEEEALKPVREVYGFLNVVRTDAQGRYEVRLNAGADIYGLVFFSRDYLPVQYRKAGLKPDGSGRAEVPMIRLYPAARVSVQVQTALERVTITGRWRFKEDQVPAWARDLCARPMDRWLSLEYSYGCAPNIAQWVFIPAEVPVQLEVIASHKDQLCPFTYPQSVCLPQGAVMDLGPCTLQEALPVILQVVDRQGRPREGVPVARRVGDIPGLTRTTDENGLASFYVPPHSSGEFFALPPVANIRKAPGLRPEAVAFEVGGAEDQGKQFTLVLSDEMLSALFKDGDQP